MAWILLHCTESSILRKYNFGNDLSWGSFERFVAFFRFALSEVHDDNKMVLVEKFHRGIDWVIEPKDLKMVKTGKYHRQVSVLFLFTCKSTHLGGISAEERCSKTSGKYWFLKLIGP